MDDTPKDQGWHPNLRFLRILVTVLTATMIGGMLVLIVLFLTRFPSGTQAAPLPDQITLPDGVQALSVTYGPGWYLVTTTGDEALVYDAATGTLRQRIALDTAD
ncbi:DUF6476 family protein [Anianabacter salinae]|uniref:DUF6476 family protein n=1 Tax=Anianabacter salinae TaxID=2851023 RepID=UPI00225E4942|nr:DUF6476 family protein [Anianabacter salinae]MBV0912836.1 hypothetical protein [Anianabacter salinae]